MDITSSFFFNYAILKDYFPFAVLMKCWLYSLCCTVHSWVHLTPINLYLILFCLYYSLPHASLVTTSLFSVFVDLLGFLFFLFFKIFTSFVWVCSVVSDSCDPMDTACQAHLFLWDSLGKNTGVGCYSLFQGIFSTQGLNRVSCIAGFLINWATRESPFY